MTQSPKKYVTNFTSSTTNRGVEAKELEIANTRVDMTGSSSTNFPVESSRESAAEADHLAAELASLTNSLPTADDTGSYIQVVVHKHNRKREVTQAAAAQTSPRIPIASSPITKVNAERTRGPCGDAPVNIPQDGSGNIYVLPHPMLLSYPTMSAPQYTWGNIPRMLVETATSARTGQKAKKKKDTLRNSTENKQITMPSNKTSAWSRICKMTDEKLNAFENVPDRVEVYYFERNSGEYLATSDGGRFTHVERLTRRGSQLVGTLVGEALAVPQLLLSLPVAALLHAERSALVVLRGAVVGTVQTVSDYCLKPALALVFNALVQPPLVFVGNVLRATRDALLPLPQALADWLEPLGRLLSSLRLVHVERAGPEGPCCASCQQRQPHPV